MPLGKQILKNIQAENIMDLFQLKEFTSQQLLLLTLKTGYSKERIKEILEAFNQIINLEIEGQRLFDINPDDDDSQKEIGNKTNEVILKYKLPNKNDSDSLKNKIFAIWEKLEENNKDLFLINKLQDLFENTFQEMEYSYAINPEAAKIWQELQNKN